MEGVLCIKRPWPSAARTVYGDHDRYLSVYTRPYPGDTIYTIHSYVLRYGTQTIQIMTRFTRISHFITSISAKITQ